MEQGLEYFGVLTGLLYLGLEIVQHRAMWIVGFVTSFVYIFVFFFSKFYADMSLNIYYVCISIYGFWQWHKGKAVQEGTEVLILYRRLNIRLISVSYTHLDVYKRQLLTLKTKHRFFHNILLICIPFTLYVKSNQMCIRDSQCSGFG